MPSIPCIAKIDSCLPCDDFPVLNISSESPDVDRYISRFSFLNAIPPIRQYPDFDEQGGGIFLQVGCMRWCWSTVSQEDADDCAERQAVECAFSPLIPDVPMPDVFHPNRISLFANQAVTGTYTCPDGNVFSYTLPAGHVVALTQGRANSAAQSLATQRARAHRVCISNMDDPICVDTWATKQITASGPTVAVFPATDLWTLVSGTIPPGMTLETGFTSDGIALSGIPNTIGEYSFRVRCTISTFGSPGYGDFMEKVFTVKIVGIEQTSPLPDAPLGIAYSQQLSASFSSNHELETWSITSGSLPDGLTLSTAGLIEGTPTGALAGYSFTVQAQFPVGSTTAVCSKAFSITVVESPLMAYWKMDETGNNDRIDSVDSVHLVSTGEAITHAAGKIVNSAVFAAAFTISKRLETGNFEDFKYSGEGITLACWFRINSKGSVNFDHEILSYQLRNAAGTLIGRVSLIYNPFIDQIYAVMSDTVTTLGTTIVTFPVLGTWYLLQAIYVESAGRLDVKLNNNAKILGGTSLTLPDSEKGSVRIIEFANVALILSFQVDEAGIWLKELSDQELDELWNGGAGNTYPNVPL